MNSKFSVTSGYIETIKENIRSISPRIKKVDVIVERPMKNCYLAKIYAGYSHQNFVARKTAKTYFECLEKAEKAILRQIEKKKNKQKKKPFRIRERIMCAA